MIFVRGESEAFLDQLNLPITVSASVNVTSNVIFESGDTLPVSYPTIKMSRDVAANCCVSLTRPAADDDVCCYTIQIFRLCFGLWWLVI